MNLVLGGDPNLGLEGFGGAGQAQQENEDDEDPEGIVEVNQAEMEAINRLVQLGFSKERAAEAYLTCEKNEEIAANFLFEMGVQDD